MAVINIEKMAQNVAEKAMQELRDNGVFIGRWIPVSVGLPEEKKLVLVTRSNGEVCIIRWNTWWYKQTKYPTIKPIAWMPLPEPYKEAAGHDKSQ